MAHDAKRSAAVAAPARLDDIDWALLEHLQEDARTTYSELGRRVGLTPPAVADRVRRLEDAGVLRGYHADVDTAALGLPLRVSIRISPGAQNSCSTVPVAVRDRPEVLSCHRVTGADCYLLDVAVADTAALEDFLDTLAEVGTPVTALILSSPVPRRTLRRPLPAP